MIQILDPYTCVLCQQPITDLERQVSKNAGTPPMCVECRNPRPRPPAA